MKFYITIAAVLFSMSAIAGPTYNYDVYASTKVLNQWAKQIELTYIEVKKVPATYKLEVPWYCNNSEQVCREEETTVSKVEAVQVEVSYLDGRRDDNGEVSDALSFNLPLDKFSSADLETLRKGKRKARTALLNSLVNLAVKDIVVPTERPNCDYQGEDWVCDGTTYIDNVKMKQVSVNLK